MTEPSRRLGERTGVQLLLGHVDVMVGRLRPKPREVAVTIDNVSMTGVGFWGDLPAAVVAGTVLSFRTGSLACPVRIRRVAEGRDGVGRAYYGAEFVDPSPAALEAINALRGAGPDPKDDLWTSRRLR